MAEPSASPEVNRIRRVYNGYRQDEAVARRWNRAIPGNHAIAEERREMTRRLLAEHGFLPLSGHFILDVGCGSGRELVALLEWGAQPENLYGVDLIEARILAARATYPGIRFQWTNAEHLPFDAGHFDLVLLLTVLSSVLDDAMARKLTSEVQRVLKPGGAVLWYDNRVRNPLNAHTRPMTRKDIRAHFPGYRSVLRSLTVIPPLARRLGPLAPVLYPVLTRCRWLHTHYLALLTKP